MDNEKVAVYVHQIKSDSIYPGEAIQRYRDVTGTVYIDAKNLIEDILKEGLAATYPSKERPENLTYIVLQNKAVQEKKECGQVKMFLIFGSFAMNEQRNKR
ncbi:hypothetical protein DM558_10285 [Entomomonas moraniae]|uniref:TNase-like domain-containing protein n=2 Tax=Entomomonas moraniae TaxID=2213226 RepID=A0A3Q9JMT3_9GAMM|nr:hypothetical protein DM558_10285 [Entomomonas moraniae]